MWVDCYSREQLKPRPPSGLGKHGELKRWRQFLIRGDPKRGKRAFQRAQRRADAQGQTIYKGRVIHGRQAKSPRRPQTADTVSAGVSPPDAGRSKMVSWNAGGLCGETKVEFEHYLHVSSDLDIALVQETHWGSSGAWKHQGWSYFHSASDKPRQAGVLVCIRSATLDESRTAWREIVPGRLIWVRACVRGQQWDLLCLYQLALTGKDGKAKDYRMKERRAVWNKLHRTLWGLPIRSLVVLGGDFNLGLESFSPVTGSGVLAAAGGHVVQEERSRVLDMLKELQMTALNTWRKPRPTYMHPTGNTQIDFIVVRRRNADRISKLTQPVDLGLSAWRGCGHRPLVASLRSFWRPWRMRRAFQPLEKPVIPPGEEDIIALRGRVKETCAGPPARFRTGVLRPLGTQVVKHWEARAVLRQASSKLGGVQSVFLLFRAACDAHRAHRELKKHCRARKREQLVSCLLEAEEAYNRGDSRAFFGFVRAVAPKQYLPQIKLRGKEGQLLTKDQEGGLLLEHVRKIFTGDGLGVPELKRMPEELFSVQSWTRALREIKPRKAVPRGEAQVAAWQQSTSANAQTLSELSKRFLCSEAPWIPTLWCKIQIAWLPKPKKTPCCPEHLRTAGLMSGDSKSFMVLLKNAAHCVVQQSLQSFPQFAYRSGASTLDAILRVAEHCHHIRRVLEGINSSKTARRLGAELPSLKGGLMVAIDLTKAFDNVTYREMYLALCESGLDEALVRLIAQVHQRTSRSVIYGSFSGSVGMSKGLRQGCPIAPLVYLAWSARFLRQVNSRLSDRWDLLHATVYADDKHLSWEIDGVHTFERAVKELGLVLQVLRDLGMEVSFGKCEAVLSLKGIKQAEILKKYTRVRNGSSHLVLRADREILIPLKTEITYLGTVLSYGSFEYATTQYRCRQAWNNYKSLRRALSTNGVLSSAERMRIYRVCIWPVIEYGLCGTGMDSRSLRLIESTVAQQLRKVLRIYEHGVSNRSVFQRADLDPRAALEHRLVCQLERIAQAAPDSVVATLHDRASQVLEFYRRLVNADGSALTPVSTGNGVPCPVCGIYFDSEAGVALHIQKRHAELHRRAKIPFDRAKHCVDGIPKCVFCLSVLGDMQAMEKHAAAGGCAIIKKAIAAGEDVETLRLRLIDDRTASTSVATAPGVGHDPRSLRSDDLDFLQRLPHIIVRDCAAQILARRPCCMLCGQRMLDVRRLKTHWQAVHKSEWSRFSAAARQHCSTLSKAVRKPCQFCLSQAKDSNLHAVQCPTLFQAMMIHELRRESVVPVAQEAPRSTLPRRSEQVAQYKTFSLENTPLGIAFRRSGHSQSRPPPPLARMLQAQSQPTADSTRMVSGCQPKRQSQLGSFFLATAAPSGGGTDAGGLWTLRLKLHNPHSLCYLNAGVHSLVHFLEVTRTADYSALTQVCRHAQNSGKVLSLHLQLVVRSLFQGWRFTNVQRDCAELLFQAVALRSDSWSKWERRDQQDVVREVGACPIFLRIPTESATTLQELVNYWVSDDGHRFLTAVRPIMIQIGRSTEHGKNHARVSFSGGVVLPVRTDAGVEQRTFGAVSGVLHLGENVTSGHYRAVLRQGSQWYIADDGVAAAPTSMGTHLTRQIYVIWLQPLDVCLPGAEFLP